MKMQARRKEDAAALRSRTSCDPPFEFPELPQSIPDWALRDASEWRRLSFFDIEVKAEEASGLEVEIRKADLPTSVWGIHIARGGRARLCINSRLPSPWERFAVFHELYHLLYHTEGEAFWSMTLHPMTRFESEADLFAWAAVEPDFRDIDQC